MDKATWTKNFEAFEQAARLDMEHRDDPAIIQKHVDAYTQLVGDASPDWGITDDTGIMLIRGSALLDEMRSFARIDQAAFDAWKQRVDTLKAGDIEAANMLIQDVNPRWHTHGIAPVSQIMETALYTWRVQELIDEMES
jgi:hypothetical protein